MASDNCFYPPVGFFLFFILIKNVIIAVIINEYRMPFIVVIKNINRKLFFPTLNIFSIKTEKGELMIIHIIPQVSPIGMNGTNEINIHKIKIIKNIFFILEPQRPIDKLVYFCHFINIVADVEIIEFLLQQKSRHEYDIISVCFIIIERFIRYMKCP